MAAAAILGALGSIYGTITNNAMAQGRENYARAENYNLNELAALNADRRTRALYRDLYSPQAQLQQLKDAGLSPSLFYGAGSGISGQSGAQGAGANGIAPNIYGFSAQEAAQIALIKAQTRKTNAEAENEEGTGTLGQAQIIKLLNEAGQSAAATALTNEQTQTQKIINYVYDNKKEVDIYTAYGQFIKLTKETELAQKEIELAENEVEISNETKEARKQQIINENAEILARIAVSQSTKKINEQQIKNLINEIKVANDNVGIALQNAETNAKNADNQEEANKIRERARKDAVEMFNNDMVAKYRELDIKEDHMLYEFGKTVVHRTYLGCQYVNAQGEAKEHKKLNKDNKKVIIPQATPSK